MGVYREDRDWSDGLIGVVKRIVGPLLLKPSSLELDCREATDLIVLRARDMHIAVRLRRPGFADRYPFEFTIRARRDSGAETELSKIVNGWGDWFFYGHSDGNGGLSPWWLIDLHSLRAGLIRDGRGEVRIRSGNRTNGDGTYFKWLDLRSFPAFPPILVASSRPLSEAARP